MIPFMDIGRIFAFIKTIAYSKFHFLRGLLAFKQLEV
jgi:hypothetical protein